MKNLNRKKVIFIIACSALFCSLSGCSDKGEKLIDDNEALEEQIDISEDSLADKDMVNSDSNEDTTSINSTDEEKINTNDVSNNDLSDSESDNDILAENGDSDDVNEYIYASIEDEIKEIEKQSEAIFDAVPEDAAQFDLTFSSSENSKLWDAELNSLWERINEKISDDEKDSLLEEEREWISFKEKYVELEGLKYEGGSMEPMVRCDKSSELTRIRCYELAGRLAKLQNEDFSLNVPVATMDYVDRQGTDDIYSELKITWEQDDNYSTVIDIFRLTTLYGTSVKQDDDLYLFEDDNLDVKGEIKISDDQQSVSFEVTESDGKLLNKGEVIDFPEPFCPHN